MIELTEMNPDTPRIGFVENPTEEQSKLLARTVIVEGTEPLNLFRLLARHAELMKRVNALGGLFMAHSTISAREREFVILRVAHMAGCEYEFAQHQPIARRVGMTHKDIDAARLPAGHADIPEDLDLLARFTDGNLALNDPSEALWQEMSDRYSGEHLLELCILPGFYRMLAGLLIATRVPVERTDH